MKFNSSSNLRPVIHYLKDRGIAETNATYVERTQSRKRGAGLVVLTDLTLFAGTGWPQTVKGQPIFETRLSQFK